MRAKAKVTPDDYFGPPLAGAELARLVRWRCARWFDEHRPDPKVGGPSHLRLLLEIQKQTGRLLTPEDAEFIKSPHLPRAHVPTEELVVALEELLNETRFDWWRQRESVEREALELSRARTVEPRLKAAVAWRLRRWYVSDRATTWQLLSEQVTEKTGRKISGQALNNVCWKAAAGENSVRTLELFFGESREQWLTELPEFPLPEDRVPERQQGGAAKGLVASASGRRKAAHALVVRTPRRRPGTASPKDERAIVQAIFAEYRAAGHLDENLYVAAEHRLASIAEPTEDQVRETMDLVLANVAKIRGRPIVT